MKIFIFIIAILTGSVATSQSFDSSWVVTHYSKKELYITMRDGVRLFTTVYMPKDSNEKHPVLFFRTPYSCAPYGENNFIKFWQGYQIGYLQLGYIMVYQDVRGRWMSEGNFENVRPFNPNKKNKETDEASDTYDAIDWLVKNLPFNNGNVGVMGISYPGFYATEAALSGHPALKAVSPQAPVTDWFAGDDIHHNGALFLSDTYGFFVEYGFGRPINNPTETAAPTDYPVTHDTYRYFLQMGSLPGFTAIANKDSSLFWDTVMNHSTYDKFWQIRNTRAGCYNIKPAMQEVGGLFDAEDCFGAWNVFKSIQKQSPATSNRLVIGPWYHGQWSSIINKGAQLGNIQFGSNTSTWYQQHIEIPFFNYYLKGEGAADSFKTATVFFTGQNEWRQFNTWPPGDVLLTDVYLQDSNKLSFSRSVNNKNPFSQYTSDPANPVPYTSTVDGGRTREYMIDDQRFTLHRPDVVMFETDTLKAGITLAGPVTADLQVSISTTDADFVVKLIDVFPDNFKYNDTDTVNMGGYEMLVRGDVMRGKFRNSLEKPVPFTPGKITEVKYTMSDVAHVFKKGHRIMVQVQSSWFPLVDRNPQQFIDIYHADNRQFIKSAIKVYHDSSHASKLILPVMQQK